MRNKDPKNPTDILGRPIAEGDVVAWAVTQGRSAELAICVIEKINFTRKNLAGGAQWRNTYIKCEQWQADRYTLRLRPLERTGYCTFRTRDEGFSEYQVQNKTGIKGDRYLRPEAYVGDVSTAQKIDHVIKLELSEDDVYDAIRTEC